MRDIKDRLKTKAAMISLGEHIAWGSDTALMIEAAGCIEQLEASNEKLAADIDTITKNLREILFHGFTGCSNGSCIVNDNGRGMRTNGSCKCFVDMSRAQLQIVQGRLQAILYNPISVQD